MMNCSDCMGCSSLRSFDQVRGEGAQRGQLAADQRQLGLHQSLTFVHVFGQLLQLRG